VPVKALNQAVKRNLLRFPEDFMFQLTLEEGRQVECLRSQIVTIEKSEEERRGRHRKYAPYAFNEQGVAMMSSVLTSERAILVNIAIIRTFVRLKQILSANDEIGRRVEELAWRQDEQAGQIHAIFNTIQHLIETPSPTPKKRIGFPAAQIGQGTSA
jgi:molybdopterin converting factor small subunit